VQTAQQALLPGMRRNETLPDHLPPEGFLNLFDGDPGPPEITLSPLRYHYQHTAEIDVVVQADTGREALFDDLCARIGAVIAADRTLGGLCDWLEARAPVPAELPVTGAAGLKAATIAIVAHYSTHDPLN